MDKTQNEMINDSDLSYKFDVMWYDFLALHYTFGYCVLIFLIGIISILAPLVLFSLNLIQIVRHT